MFLVFCCFVTPPATRESSCRCYLGNAATGCSLVVPNDIYLKMHSAPQHLVHESVRTYAEPAHCPSFSHASRQQWYPLNSKTSSCFPTQSRP